MTKRWIMFYSLIILMIFSTSILVQGMFKSLQELSQFAIARGVVTDRAGKPIKEVSVEIVPVGRQLNRKYIRLSDQNGRWYWQVPSGVYNIHLRKKGFQSHN